MKYSVGEEGGFHGQSELVTLGGIDTPLVVHPSPARLTLFVGASGLAWRRWGSGVSDERADARMGSRLHGNGGT